MPDRRQRHTEADRLHKLRYIGSQTHGPPGLARLWWRTTHDPLAHSSLGPCCAPMFGRRLYEAGTISLVGRLRHLQLLPKGSARLWSQRDWCDVAVVQAPEAAPHKDPLSRQGPAAQKPSRETCSRDRRKTPSGSPTCQASFSSLGRSSSGSARECPRKRYVCASMSVGPSPRRARAMASVATSCTWA